MNPKSSTPIDIELGRRLREARERIGLSQTTLGEAVGVTFQQVQKYEKGQNRLSVVRLLSIANALNTPVESFLEGLSDMARGEQNRQSRGSRRWPKK